MTPADLAALFAAALPEERLTADELSHLCFGPGDEIIGDVRGAATLQVHESVGGPVAWLTALAVDPAEQGHGRGRELVTAVVERARARGARRLELAAAVPRYLWPGVDLANTRAGMLVEACGFRPGLLGINMAIPTGFRREPPTGVLVERETGAGAHRFAADRFPHWVPELDRSVALGTTFAARDRDGATIAFGCHSVNRAGWIGPMATDPDRQATGVGSAVIAAVCADLEHRGFTEGEISWVSNLRFYGKCGARVSRVFLGGSLAC
ncbi:MAG: GNAT family N-acetyltransferase [Actinomycetota bacterium]